VLSPRARRVAAGKLAAQLGFDPERLDTDALNLSGGNQQELVLGKWLHREPRVLLLDEPTRGIDLGAKQEIFQTVRKLTDQGMAVILVSSDLEEVVEYSERILVLARGRQIGLIDGSGAGVESILNMIFSVEGRPVTPELMNGPSQHTDSGNPGGLELACKLADAGSRLRHHSHAGHSARRCGNRKSRVPVVAELTQYVFAVGGETKNPYDVAHDPGGSSAGTGAAVAANLAAIGIGEDTGGSIRLPASFTNLVGVRVTPGLISRQGLAPLVVFQDTAGPMGRTVTDTAILLDAIVGYDPKDPYTTAYLIADHKGSYTQNLDANGLKGARIGVLKEAFGGDDDPDCAQVNSVIRKAIESIRSAGAKIVPVSLPNLMEFIVETSLYITHSRHDINQFLAARPQLAYSSIDAIVKDGKYHRKLDLIDAVMTGPLEPADDPTYYRRLAARDAFQRAVVGIIGQHDLDGICFPSCQVLPPTRTALQSGRWTVLGFPTNTLIAAQTWLPSICVPAGFSPGGLPVGLEMVVLPYHEPELFRLGYAFEQATRHRRAPKM
jgi:amidase